MKLRVLQTVLFFVLLTFSINIGATTYTFTGAAGSNVFLDMNNWSANGRPPLGVTASTDEIIFDADCSFPGGGTINNGTYRVNVGKTLTFASSGFCSSADPDNHGFVNQGIFNNYGIVILDNAVFTNASAGTLTNYSGSTFTILHCGTIYNNGLFTNNASSTLNIGTKIGDGDDGLTAFVNSNGGTLNNSGTILNSGIFYNGQNSTFNNYYILTTANGRGRIENLGTINLIGAQSIMRHYCIFLNHGIVTPLKGPDKTTFRTLVDGTVNITGGAVLDINREGEFAGGIINYSNGGIIRVNSFVALREGKNFTVPTGGTLRLNQPFILFTGSSLTNYGTLSGNVELHTGSNFTNNSLVTNLNVDVDQGCTFTNSSSGIINSSSIVIYGVFNNAGALNDGGISLRSGTLNNTGSYSMNSANSYFGSNADPFVYPSGNFTWNGGTIGIGGSLVLSEDLNLMGSKKFYIVGNLTINNGVTFTNANGIDVNGSILNNGTLSCAGAFNFGFNSVSPPSIQNNGVLNSSGTFEIRSSSGQIATLTNNGTINNTGGIYIEPSTILNNNGILNNYSILATSGNGTFTNAGTLSLLSINGTTWGGLYYSETTNFTMPGGTFNWNSGLLQVSSFVSLTISNDLIIPANANLDMICPSLTIPSSINVTNNGRFRISGYNTLNTFTNNGILTNNGSLQYRTTFATLVNNNIVKGIGSFNLTLQDNTGSIIAPGNNSVGTLSFRGNYVLGNTTYECDINGATDASIDKLVFLSNYNSQVDVSAATLKVNWGFTPSVGESYTILTASAVTGTFATVNIPTISGVVFIMVYNATSIIINVEAATINVQSARTGNWDVGSTWLNSIQPATNASVTINSGHNVTFSTAQQCRNLTVVGQISTTPLAILDVRNVATFTNGNLSVDWGTITPLTGSSYTLLTFGSHVGKFASITISPISGLLFTTTYNSTTLVLSVTTTTPCGVPQNLVNTLIEADNAIVAWDAVSSTSVYQARIQKTTDIATSWTAFTTNSTFKNFVNLDGNTSYYVQVRASCDNGISFGSWSSFGQFRTSFGTKQAGNWTDPNTWAGNAIPPDANRGILVKHNLNVNTNAGCRYLTVKSGTVTIPANYSFSINLLARFMTGGGLSVTGGTLNSRAQLNFAAGSSIYLSSGTISIDGGGDPQLDPSVLNGSSLFIDDNATANFTGGTLQIYPPSMYNFTEIIEANKTFGNFSSCVGTTVILGGNSNGVGNYVVGGTYAPQFYNLTLRGQSTTMSGITVKNTLSASGGAIHSTSCQFGKMSLGNGLTLYGNYTLINTCSGTPEFTNLGTLSFDNSMTLSVNISNYAVFNIPTSVTENLLGALNIQNGRVIVNGGTLDLRNATLSGLSATHYFETKTGIGAYNSMGSVLLPAIGSIPVKFDLGLSLPSGTSVYAPVNIVSTNGSSNISVNLQTLNAPTGYVSPNIQWNITPSGSSPNLTITFTWPASAESVLFTNARQLNNGTVRVYHYNSTTSTWEGLTTSTITTNPDGTFRVTATGITSFSPFAVLAPDTPTPIDLLSFSAQAKGSTAELTWQTATEENALNFEIEKSLDGINFEKIGEVKAQNAPSKYQAMDEKFFQLSYYRLKNNDIDGKFTYSKIVSLKNLDSKYFILAPNPAKNSVMVTYNGASSATLQVFDLLGRTLVSKTLTNASTDVDISDFASGSYIVELNVNGQFFREKLMKK